MIQLKKFLKRYRLFLLLLALNILLLLFEPRLGQKVAARSIENLLEMLSIIPPIFLLLGLMDVWVPKETIMKYMGPNSGVKGGVLAFAMGSLASGPLYAAFPVAMMLLRKGVSLTNVFIFLGAWSTTKVPMMLFEITQLGSKFALVRLGVNVIGIIFLAVIMEKTTTQKDAEMIYELAAKQGNEGS